MTHEILIQGRLLSSAHPMKSPEQQFSEKVIQYARDTSRAIASPEELARAVTALKTQQLALKDFCKLFLQSTGSQDLDKLRTFAQETHLPIAGEQSVKPNKISEPIQNLRASDAQQTAESERNFMAHLSIIQTTADDQILVSQLIQKIFGGQTRELFKLFRDKPVLLEALLDGLGKYTTMGVIQYRATIGFVQSLIAQGIILPPEIMAKLKKYYSKIRKNLDDIEDLLGAGDDARLSSQARAFLKDFYALELRLEPKEELPEDLQNSYLALMETLEQKETACDGV